MDSMSREIVTILLFMVKKKKKVFLPQNMFIFTVGKYFYL